MITNKTQYATANRLLRELRVELRLLERSVVFNPRNLPQVQRLEEVRELVPELERQVEEYSELVEGRRKVDLSVVERIPELLIKARVTARLTQGDLARIVGMTRQQITRYEKEKFQSASLKSITRIARALTAAMELRWANVRQIKSREQILEFAPNIVSDEDTVRAKPRNESI